MLDIILSHHGVAMSLFLYLWGALTIASLIWAHMSDEPKSPMDWAKFAAIVFAWPGILPWFLMLVVTDNLDTEKYVSRFQSTVAKIKLRFQ
jgi:hypothetical protein